MPHPYFQHLSDNADFKAIIHGAEPREIRKQHNIALFLYASIISQQLSTKVGDVFYKRFLELFGGEPTAQQVLDMPIEKLQSIGLSKSKAGYIQNVARFDMEHGLEHDTLIGMPDEQVTALVTSIKGIGKWSAQNLLMFGLGREDIFSGDDLIIQHAMARIFSLDKSDKKKFKADVERLSEQWSPYRTFACLHLWQWYHKK